MFCALIIAISITMAGCISGTDDSGESPMHINATPSPSPTPGPDMNDTITNLTVSPINTPVPTVLPDYNWAPVSPSPTPMAGTDVTPVPSPEPTATPVPTPTLQPVISGMASDWGSDKNTYSGGETATGWAYVTNTGNVPIDQINFILVIKRTIGSVPVSRTTYYNSTGLNIQPGMKQQVVFSQSIPSEYEGIPTAGDYELTVTALLNGDEIGSYSENITIV